MISMMTEDSNQEKKQNTFSISNLLSKNSNCQDELHPARENYCNRDGSQSPVDDEDTSDSCSIASSCGSPSQDQQQGKFILS